MEEMESLIFLCKSEDLNQYELISELDYSDLIIQDEYGETALCNLCQNNNITYYILEVLNYTDLIVKDKDGKIALMYLCENKNVRFIYI